MQVYFWRRLDMPGLERLELETTGDEIVARATTLCLEAGGCRIDHHWRLTPEWRVKSVSVERWDSDGHAQLRLERAGNVWQVNGAARPDLDGAAEPDLSVTPFCNTFLIRRMPQPIDASQAFDVAFVDGPSLVVRRSSQQYDRLGATNLRFTSPDPSIDFEAELSVDADGMIVNYEHLFERVTPSQ